LHSLVLKPRHFMNASYSTFQTGRPSASRSVTTDFMLSVSTWSGIPRAMNAWMIPMKRFSWRALVKNST